MDGAPMRRRIDQALLWYVRNTPVHYKRAGIYQRLVEPSLIKNPIRTVATAQLGLQFHCSTDDIIQRHLYAFGVWEPALTAFVRTRLRAGDSFVDVGANVGYFALLASSIVGPSGRVVAIEPSPSIAEELRKNVALNPSQTIRVITEAASDSVGFATMYRADDTNRGTSTLLPSRGFERECEVRTAPLSQILQPDELTSARIIKIDVEGSEGRVVQGLLSSLPQARQDLEMLIEISPADLELQGTSAGEVIGQLADVGFNAYTIENYYEAYRYVAGAYAQSAVRLSTTPSGTGPFDLVFSRIDAPELPVNWCA